MSDKINCSKCQEWAPHIDGETSDNVELDVKSGKLTKPQDTCSKWLCNCGACPIDTVLVSGMDDILIAELPPVTTEQVEKLFCELDRLNASGKLKILCVDSLCSTTDTNGVK